MCDPATLAIGSLAITAATAIGQQVAVGQQARAQADAIRTSTVNNYGQDVNQQNLVNTEAWQKENANAIQAREGRATAATAAGEAGVQGNSVYELQRSYFTRQGNYDESVEQNRQADVDRLQLQQQGFTDQAQGELNKIQQPNWLDAGLTIAGAAGGAYTKAFPSDANGNLSGPLADLFGNSSMSDAEANNAKIQSFKLTG